MLGVPGQYKSVLGYKLGFSCCANKDSFHRDSHNIYNGDKAQWILMLIEHTIQVLHIKSSYFLAELILIATFFHINNLTTNGLDLGSNFNSLSSVLKNHIN